MMEHRNIEYRRRDDIQSFVDSTKANQSVSNLSTLDVGMLASNICMLRFLEPNAHKNLQTRRNYSGIPVGYSGICWRIL